MANSPHTYGMRIRFRIPSFYQPLQSYRTAISFPRRNPSPFERSETPLWTKSTPLEGTTRDSPLFIGTLAH